MEPRFRTEQDLLALKDQLESSRLEFKSSSLLKEKKEKYASKLSREISAFANSEGEDIIIGIAEEKRGKGHVAAGVDECVDLSEVPLESLQQTVQDSVSPYLPGIRVRSVPLSGQQGRVALVISVPQGSTAYQASDKLYYDRSEFGVRALPDHEIRLRMMRGHVPQARVEVVDCELLTAEQEFAQRQGALRALDVRIGETGPEEVGRLISINKARQEALKAMEAARRAFDEYSFRLNVANTGDVTLHDFLLSVRFDTKLEVSSDGATATEAQASGDWMYRFAEGQRREAGAITYQMGDYQPPPKKIFPGATGVLSERQVDYSRACWQLDTGRWRVIALARVSGQRSAEFRRNRVG